MSVLVIVAIIFAGGTFLQHRGKVKREERDARAAFVRDSSSQARRDIAIRDSTARAARAAEMSLIQSNRAQFESERKQHQEEMRETLRCAPMRRVYETNKDGTRTLKPAIHQPGCGPSPRDTL